MGVLGVMPHGCVYSATRPIFHAFYKRGRPLQAVLCQFKDDERANSIGGAALLQAMPSATMILVAKLNTESMRISI